MTVQELIDILSNKEEIPDPELAVLCFFIKDKDGNDTDIKLKSIGAFDICRDITICFEVVED